jgi:hypothetical protein
MIARDIGNEQKYASDENQARVAQCEREYQENNCADKENILPALVSFCQEREDCVTFKPSDIARSTIAARHLGTLINEFLNPLSYKALAMILVLVAAFLWLPGLLASWRQT